MELRTAFQLVRKWLWLLVLGAVLAGGAAYMVVSRQPKQYQASAIVAVGTTLEVPNPDSSFLNAGSDLAGTYVILARTREVLNAAIIAGKFPVTPDELRGLVSAYVIENTPLLGIDVRYTDSYVAADMANEIAHQLILKSPSNLTEVQQTQLDIANAEIIRLNDELKEAREELRALEDDLLAATDPATIERLRAQRYTLVALINEKSSNIAEFTATIAGLQKRTNALTVVESALPPTSPIGLGGMEVTLAGVVLGAAAALGCALLIEYFDDSIASPADAAHLLSLPILGTISRFGPLRSSYSKRLIVHQERDAPAAEGYRGLRTSLLFLSDRSPGRSAFIVTSPGKSEGKTVTVANLAVSLAHAGLRVLLVDADLRNPTIHRVFNLDNSVGLSTLALILPTEPPAASNGSTQALLPLTQAIQQTEVPGLQVITSGPPPINPSELLGSEAVRQWVCYLRALPEIDVLLFDTPPLLAVTDSSALAVSVELPVILVLRAKRTRSGAAATAKEQLDVLGAQTLGIVFNGAQPPSGSYYYYGRYGA